MRTTLDIDNDVLQLAKEIAAARRQTAGKVISDFAREAMTQPTVAPYSIKMKDGFPLLTGAPTRPVTPELVDRLLLEADLEDAGLRP